MSPRARQVSSRSLRKTVSGMACLPESQRRIVRSSRTMTRSANWRFDSPFLRMASRRRVICSARVSSGIAGVGVARAATKRPTVDARLTGGNGVNLPVVLGRTWQIVGLNGQHHEQGAGTVSVGTGERARYQVRTANPRDHDPVVAPPLGLPRVRSTRTGDNDMCVGAPSTAGEGSVLRDYCDGAGHCVLLCSVGRDCPDHAPSIGDICPHVNWCKWAKMHGLAA